MTHTPPVPIMLLGTFHFADKGLDGYKPTTTFDVNARQVEVQDVVERLAAFKPTKIAVELRAAEQEAMNQSYRAYVRGKLELGPDEVHQLGFQLARQLGHDGLYGVNAWDRYYDPPLDFEKLAQGRSALELNAYADTQLDFHPHEDLAVYAEEHGQSYLLTEWDAYYHGLFEKEDEERLNMTLRDILCRANEAGALLEGHGYYMVGPIKIGAGNEYPGVDYVMHWFNRNLRIFANIQRITEPGDRLLLIIGGGHVPILRHCVEASPEYDLAEVGDYL